MKPDVTIVGASAAGLFTAARLAGQGARVRVLERATSFPPVARTLIATHRLRDVLGGAGEGSIVNEIRGFELFADGVAASVELRHPDLIVERSVLMRDLERTARASGAEVVLGRRFVGAVTSTDALVVRAEQVRTERDESFETTHVVGADGANSRVARAGGWPQQTTVPLIQAVVRCPAGLPPDTVRVWFRPGETPYFYWLIPEGDGRGVVGLIGEERHEVRASLDRFLHEKSLEAVAYQAARIPLYREWRPVRKRVANGVFYLVGDAAGHVKSSTVGGLVTGFRGAVAVADAVLGRRSGDLRRLRRELDLHILVRRILQRFGEPEYKRLLGLLDRPEHHLLASYSRDDTARLLWRLCLREPRLAGLALTRLWSGRRAQSSGRTWSNNAIKNSPAATSQAITR